MVFQQNTDTGGAQPEETAVNVTESKGQGVEGDAQTSRIELAASLQVRSLLYVVIILDFFCRKQCFPSGFSLGVI